MKKITMSVAILVALSFAAPVMAETIAPASGYTAAANTALVAARARRARWRKPAAVAAVAARKEPARWVYRAWRMRPPKNDKWKSRWNQLGQDGWELVAAQENFYIFKRPAEFGMPDSAATPSAAAVSEPKAAPKHRSTGSSGGTKFESSGKAGGKYGR